MKSFFGRSAIILILTLSASNMLTAQVQSPAQYLGYELGERYTQHHQVMDYFRHVAENSDRVTLHSYGKTYQHRELLYVVVTSPQNHANIEEIRSNNLKLTGLLEGTPSASQKAIVWLSYNVHGNETSSSEAALKTIYELTQTGNTDASGWLDNTVVIIDPMLNPDGRERYVNWFTQTMGANMNPLFDAREHHEPWPGGRTNHYYFDLNRDWAWQTQIETQHRIEVYQQWMPHVHVDFHEQGFNSPYYFAPAAEPFHKAITPWQREFQTTIGENNARYFDEDGKLYFTREIFDLFYPSYGDTWPTFNGAIGMTYEQAGHSLAGIGIITSEGDTLTLKNRLTNHYITGMSTIEVTSQHADRVISEFRNHFNRGMTNPDSRYKTFVVKGSNHPDKLHALLSYLDDQQIQYGLAGSSRNADGYNYTTGENGRISVQADDILISAYQPKSQLVRVLFEPRPELADSLTYDITAWEAHYRFGLDGYALEGRLNPSGAVSAVQFQTYEHFGNLDNPYAYIAKWETFEDGRFLAALFQKGVRTRFATQAFSIDGKEYIAGTIIITRAGNERLATDFNATVKQTAAEHRRNLHGVSTGFVTSGQDFGSSGVRFTEAPHVAMLAGEGTGSNSAGEVWHFFDHQLNYPVTVVNTSFFNRADLSQYDVLILPPGGYGSVLNESGLTRLAEWVRGGGKLIALGSANNTLAGSDLFGISRKRSQADQDDSPESKLRTFDERRREGASNSNPGSIYKIRVDHTHPLGYGYPDHYFSLKLDSSGFSYLDNGWNVGAATPDAHISGFIGENAKTNLEHTLSFGMQNMGQGSVYYFPDNPLFRGFWENGKLLFVNALFY